MQNCRKGRRAEPRISAERSHMFHIEVSEIVPRITEAVREKMAYIPRPNPCFLDGLEFFKVIDGRKVYRRGRLLYSWDELHGEIEVFDRRGYHMGALDAVTGEQVKPPRKERRLHV